MVTRRCWVATSYQPRIRPGHPRGLTDSVPDIRARCRAVPGVRAWRLIAYPNSRGSWLRPLPDLHIRVGGQRWQGRQPTQHADRAGDTGYRMSRRASFPAGAVQFDQVSTFTNPCDPDNVRAGYRYQRAFVSAQYRDRAPRFFGGRRPGFLPHAGPSRRGGVQRGRNGPLWHAGPAIRGRGGHLRRPRTPPPARRDTRRTGLVPPGAIAAMASRSPSGVSRYRQAGRRFNTRYCALMGFGCGVCGGRNASWVLPPADSANV